MSRSRSSGKRLEVADCMSLCLYLIRFISVKTSFYSSFWALENNVEKSPFGLQKVLVFFPCRFEKPAAVLCNSSKSHCVILVMRKKTSWFWVLMLLWLVDILSVGSSEWGGMGAPNSALKLSWGLGSGECCGCWSCLVTRVIKWCFS